MIKYGRRISLHPLSQEHCSALFQVIDHNRLHLRRWLPWVDDTDSEDRLTDFIRHTTADTASVTLVIFCHRNIAGVCSLNALHKQPGQARVGYWLAEEYCGQGIMTRALMGLIQFAYKSLNLKELILCAAEHNKKSRSLAERVGFKATRKIMDAEDLYGEMVNHIRYVHTPTP